jgi:hypothetical protein
MAPVTNLPLLTDALQNPADDALAELQHCLRIDRGATYLLT